MLAHDSSPKGRAKALRAKWVSRQPATRIQCVSYVGIWLSFIMVGIPVKIAGRATPDVAIRSPSAPSGSGRCFASQSIRIATGFALVMTYDCLRESIKQQIGIGGIGPIGLIRQLFIATISFARS